MKVRDKELWLQRSGTFRISYAVDDVDDDSDQCVIVWTSKHTNYGYSGGGYDREHAIEQMYRAIKHILFRKCNDS